MAQIPGTWKCKGDDDCPHRISLDDGSGEGICMRWSQSPCIKTGKYADWALTPETITQIQNKQFREVLEKLISMEKQFR
jgi:hypothetical protein